MPTVTTISLKAEKFKQELEDVVARTRAARQAMESPGKVDTERSADAIQKVSKAAETTAGAISKTAEGADALGKSVKKSVKTAADEVKTLGGQMKDAFRSAWKELTDGEGAAKGAAGALKGMFSPVGLAVAAISAGVKLAADVWDHFTENAAEAAAKADAVAAASAKSREEVEATAKIAQEYLARLRELSFSENAANGSKREAVSLVTALVSRYGDLGAKVDAATGKILNMSEVTKRAGEAMSKVSIEAMSRELKDLKGQRDAQFIASFAGLTSDRGARKQLKTMNQLPLEQQLALAVRERNSASTAQDITGWQKQIDLLSTLVQKEKELRYFRNTGYRSREEEIAANRESYRKLETSRGTRREREKQFAQKQEDDRIAAENDPNWRRFLLNQQAFAEMDNRDRLGREIEAKKGELSGVESEKQRLAILNEIELLEAKRLQSVEKIYGYEQQAAAITRQQAESKKKMVEASEFELQYQKLLNERKTEEAARLKLNYELKQRYLRLTDEEIQKELDKQEKLRSFSLQKGLRDQGLGLQDQAMRRAGFVRQAEVEKALRDAETQKGSKLTTAEAKKVRELSDLLYRMNTDPGRSTGSMEIRTNSLTARGGFASGAVLPDRNRVNLEIRNYNKRQLDMLSEIKQICTELGKF